MLAGSLAQIQQGLLSVGYRQDRLKFDVPAPRSPSRNIGMVAYADQPFDARTSALVAVDGNTFDDASLSLLEPLGSPIIAHCQRDHVVFLKQLPGETRFIDRVPSGKISSYFQSHREEFAPAAIYRAKIWGRMDQAWQSDFVDVGLLPVIEQSAGEELRKLLERVVTSTKSALGWKKDISDADGKWLLKSVFWLLAAKILQDKSVPGFIRLDFSDLDGVYLKLAKHYHKDDPKPVAINSPHQREALRNAADMIRAFGHCGSVTTESLAWVYESALIDRETRQKLGTHSTPTWLVDEIVAKLRPWIEDIPVDDRRVFEPACGHAGFLISAMRLLSELLPEDRVAERKDYLRQRLRGIEIDPFAYEVARLSLTLADVPNPNGWMLENADMFAGNALRSAVTKANIVLANPPFEKFGNARPTGAMHSRADETFRQIVDALPPQGIFGIVMPQGILHSTQGKDLRRKLLDDYELSEITLFADKIFNYGEPETAVILGRRVGGKKKRGPISYRRVREEQIESYAKTLAPSSQMTIAADAFNVHAGSLFVPELEDVWRKLQNCPKLGQFVTGGQGSQHKGKNASSLPQNSIRESDVEITGLTKGFAGWEERQLTHELPRIKWLNLDPATIRRALHGTVVGKTQILLNYARVSRNAWRLKALRDCDGHPVTSRFLAFRPNKTNVSLNVLWAILNSPIANAYTYSHSSKRDVLTGTLSRMPVFALGAGNTEFLDSIVATYFEAAKKTRALLKQAKHLSTSPDPQLSLTLPEDDRDSVIVGEDLKHLHWRIDAEVLRLYNLPEEMERRVLDLFTGIQRRGVPFVQNEYFPIGFNDVCRLSDLLAITADWTKTNRRRCLLIKKDVKNQLSKDEQAELAKLESLADARIALLDLQQPPKPDEVDRAVERLKREGKWKE